MSNPNHTEPLIIVAQELPTALEVLNAEVAAAPEPPADSVAGAITNEELHREHIGRGPYLRFEASTTQVCAKPDGYECHLRVVAAFDAGAVSPVMGSGTTAETAKCDAMVKVLSDLQRRLREGKLPPTSLQVVLE